MIDFSYSLLIYHLSSLIYHYLFEVFKAVPMSLKICFMHIFFVDIQYFDRKLFIEQMIHDSHIFYGMMSYKYFIWNREIIKYIFYFLIFFKFIECDTDHLMFWIHAFCVFNRKIICHSSIHKHMFLIRDYREYSWNGHTPKKDSR